MTSLQWSGLIVMSEDSGIRRRFSDISARDIFIRHQRHYGGHFRKGVSVACKMRTRHKSNQNGADTMRVIHKPKFDY